MTTYLIFLCTVDFALCELQRQTKQEQKPLNTRHSYCIYIGNLSYRIETNLARSLPSMICLLCQDVKHNPCDQQWNKKYHGYISYVGSGTLLVSICMDSGLHMCVCL